MVARAIVAACKETGADPVAVASGERNRAGTRWDFKISRARNYAAYALRETHKGCGTTAIARMVGAGSPSSYLAVLDHNIRNGKAPWWDAAAVKRVIAAIRAGDGEFMRESGRIVMRRKPATDCFDMTSELMGDPPHSRSALADREVPP